MNILIYILVILSYIRVSISTHANYPNCIQREFVKSNKDTNFNKKFIKLSSFLFEQDQKQNITTQEKSFSSQDHQSYFQSIENSRINYIIIFAFMGFFCFLLVVIRTKWSYLHRLRIFLSKSIGGIVNPCAVSLSIIVFTFFILFTSTSSLLPKYIETAQCSQRYIKDLVLQGKNQSNWAGFYGYEKLIRLHMKYIQVVQNMPTSYDFKIAPILNRRQNISAYTSQFLNQFEDAFVQYNTQIVNFTTLFPSLFSSKELLEQLNSSNHKLLTIGDMAINIQNEVKDSKISSQNNRISLEKKIPFFLMPAQLLNGTNLFYGGWRNEKRKQGNDIMFLGTKIFIGIGLQTSFSYFCLILILMKAKHGVLFKFTNFLWVLLIVEFLLSLFLMYFYSGMAREHTSFCPTFQKTLSSKQTYYNNMNTSSTTNQNMFRLLQPCFFGNSKFNDMAIYSQDSSGLMALMGNLTFYMNIMDPTHADYLDSFAYSRAYVEAISYVQKQQYNGNQNWIYLRNVLEQLNNYTLLNYNNDGCYKNRWVFDRSGCGAGQDVLNMTNNNVLISGSANYSAYKIKCIPLNSRDVSGKFNHIANYSDILSNYQNNKNQSRCAATIVQIQRIAMTLTNAMLSKYQAVKSIKYSLQQEIIRLDELLRILRTNYILKKQQFNYMMSMGTATPTGTNQYRDWNYALKTHNNCSCIKEQSVMLYELLCVDMRADVLKTYLILVLLEIGIAILIIFGAIYGLNQQLKELEHLLQPQNSSIQLQDNKQVSTHKYMSHFFSPSKND